MPVKVKKQLDPTAELIKQLQEENAKLLAQLQSMGSEEIEKERREWEEKLQTADQRVQESQKALEAGKILVSFRGGRGDLELNAMTFWEEMA